MLELRVYGATAFLRTIAAWLESSGLTRRATLLAVADEAHAVLIAYVPAHSAHDLLAQLRQRGVNRADMMMIRVEDVVPRHPGSLFWSDLLGHARRNARPVARYLVFLIAAGVIAGYGVVTVNPTLIVGAMAVSPDTLPIASACIGIVTGRPILVGRAVGTLVVGLATIFVAALIVGLTINALHRVPADFTVGESTLAPLVTVGFSTVGVALAAGVAGMLAFETRAAAAVGVAISVTTVPATAFLGVAIAVGKTDRIWGSLAVLGINVGMLLVAGTATLALQRRLAGRITMAGPGDRDIDAPTTGDPEA